MKFTGFVIECPWLFEKVLKGYTGITLFPFIFVKTRDNQRLIAHERIHIWQQTKYLLIGFYLSYGVQYLYYLIKYRDHKKAYYNISFEREAFTKTDPGFVTRYAEMMKK